MRRPLIPGLSALAVILVASAGCAAEILTPPAPATPRINGPSIYGQRPGRPFLHTIPATGDRPMTFSADGLPEGLSIDSETAVSWSHMVLFRCSSQTKRDRNSPQRIVNKARITFNNLSSLRFGDRSRVNLL